MEKPTPIEVSAMNAPATAGRTEIPSHVTNRAANGSQRSRNSSRQERARNTRSKARSTGGSVKLRGVSFTAKGFGIERVRDDYRQLSRLLHAIIRISGGGDTAIARLPPDYREFLALLGRDTLAMEDEFLIVNNAALLPMKNR